MARPLADQTALVTGAGSGIGLAIARALAARGVRVILNDIVEERTEAAAELIRTDGGACEPFPGDAGEVARIYAMVDHAEDTFGGLDMAVANAGLTLFGDVFSYSAEAFQRTVTLNLQGSFFLAQAAANHMRKHKRTGKILLMSSVLAVQPHLDLAPYCMTKAAIGMLARTMALELAPYGITINAIAPGATRTDRTMLDDPGYVERWTRITPSGRLAEPEDIARAALFLLSANARHITGQTLVVDGGWSQTAFLPHMVDAAPE